VTVTAGSGGQRTATVNPTGVGYADVTLTVTDGDGQTTTGVLHYAASAASSSPSTTHFLAGTSDASSAQMVDGTYAFVGDDENQGLRLYRRDVSGLAVATFDFTSLLGLTDMSNGQAREVDLESSARAGNRIYWLGSLDNNSDGQNRPNRDRLFATDLSGSGAS